MFYLMYFSYHDQFYLLWSLTLAKQMDSKGE